MIGREHDSRVTDMPFALTAAHLRLVLAAGARAGLSRAQILSAARILPGFEETDACVSLAQFSAAYALVADALDDELIGLLSRPVRRGTIELICRSCCTAAHFEEAVILLAKGFTLLSDHPVSCRTDNDGIWLMFEGSEDESEDSILAWEVLVLTAYAVLSWLEGQRPRLLKVLLPLRVAPHRHELRELLPGRLRFAPKGAALLFATPQKRQPIRHATADVARFVRRAPASFIEMLLVHGEHAARTRRLLLDALPALPAFSSVARHFALSPRSFHRKLREEGETFRTIRDQVRRDFAVHALLHTTAPIKAIAIDVGFSDQTAFQRAFATWTGVPPGHFRHQAAKPLQVHGAQVSAGDHGGA